MDIELTYGRGLKISDKNLDCTQLIVRFLLSSFLNKSILQIQDYF